MAGGGARGGEIDNSKKNREKMGFKSARDSTQQHMAINIQIQAKFPSLG